MPKKAKPKQFATEVELCAAFLAAIDAEEWTSYSETEGWDILLVRKADGFQIGIEAKLRLNVDVVNQVLEEYGNIGVERPGPDCRACLVPGDAGGGFDRIAAYIGFTILRVYARPKGGYGGQRVSPTLPRIRNDWSAERWHEWAPAKRHRLPEYVPDVPAGAPAPLQLTDWKIRALKLQAIIEKNGRLTRADFKAVGMDHRRWVAKESGWLTIRDGHFVKGYYFPDIAAQHPSVYAKVVADMGKWDKRDSGGTLL